MERNDGYGFAVIVNDKCSIGGNDDSVVDSGPVVVVKILGDGRGKSVE